MEQLSLGMFGISRKENERRLPIHPLHLDRIEADLRGRIFLERGYGERFGMSDAQLGPMVAGVRSRRELVATIFDQHHRTRFGLGENPPESDGAVAGIYDQ